MNEKKERPGVMFYFSVRPCLARLSDIEKGQLFEAILNYGEFGVLPEFEGMVGIAWDFIKPRIDDDAARYEKISKKRKDAANIRWHGDAKAMQPMQLHTNAEGAMQTMPITKPNTKPITNPNTETNEFKPPALEEVKAYCDERGNGIDPQRFIDYYAASGWKRGNTPVTDWKACVRSWEKHEASKQQTGGNVKAACKNYEFESRSKDEQLEELRRIQRLVAGTT